MTTIAWDGKTVAADRLATRGGNLRSDVSKLHVSIEWVYGGAGQLDATLEIAHWLLTGASPDARPTLEEGGAYGLAIRRSDGRCFRVEGKRPVLCEVRETFTACGSGRDFAIAAMALGKNARDAVKLAAQFDIFTGGGVDVRDVRAGKRLGARLTQTT